MIGPAWSLGLPSFPLSSQVCALFEIRLLFSSKTNDGEKRKKKKATQGWKVVASYSWLPALAKKAVLCPQLTPGRQALCKWEAVSMSAHLRLSSRKEREEKKKKPPLPSTEKPQDQLIPVDCSQARALVRATLFCHWGCHPHARNLSGERNWGWQRIHNTRGTIFLTFGHWECHFL